MMMALGTFRFGLDTAAYDELAHATGFKWAPLHRAGAKPTLQPMGGELDTVRLSGRILPTWRGELGSMRSLMDLQAAGEPLQMTDGTGGVWGKWVIERVTDRVTELFADSAPRRLEFTVQLREYVS